MQLLDLDRPVISRLQVRGASKNTPAQRLRWQRLVEELNFNPPGLPPRAVLLVKQIHFAMPPPEKGRRESFKQHELLLQTQLATLARAAVRPQQGRLPESAEAVVFSDTAELFACLALEARQGNVAQRWWWRALLRTQRSWSLTQVLALLCEQPRFAPATWEYLQTWRQAAAVVQQISPAVARNLVQALLREFDLSPLTSGFADGLGAEGFDSPRIPLAQLEPRSTPASSSDDLDFGFWEEYLPDLAAERFEQKVHVALLGLSLLLHRAPLKAGQPEFIRKFRHWMIHQPQPSAPVKSDRPATLWAKPSAADDAATLLAGESHDAENARSAASAPPASDEMPSATMQQDARLFSPAEPRPNALTPGEPTNSARSPHEADHHKSPALQFAMRDQLIVKDDAPASPANASRWNEDHAAEEREMSSTAPQEVTPPALNKFSGENCRTEIGGILFLIPLLQHLRLFATARRPFAVMHELSAWAWLELIGRMLLGETFGEAAHDPIWSMLAALDGRQIGEPCGTAFCGKTEYVMPNEWLVPVSQFEEHWTWHLDKTRLRVLHPAGFMAADLMISPESLTARLQALQEDWRLDAASLRHAADQDLAAIEAIQSQIRTGKAALDRWLQFLLPYLRWRLVTALKLENLDGETISRQLLFRRGELFVTRTHIDLVMSIDDATLNVRVAGLDCNPGWVSALSRVVTFHYA